VRLVVVSVIAGLLTTTLATTSASAIDYTCTARAQGDDVALTFAGSQVGLTANLRDSGGWVATVTGLEAFIVDGGGAESYLVVLNSLGTDVPCTAPEPEPQPVEFDCTVTAVGGDARLEFSGNGVGTTANLRDSGGWVATVTARSDYVVPGGAGETYRVVLNTAERTEPCVAAPPPPPMGYVCIVMADGADVTITFGGPRAESENLRRDGRWAATVTAQDEVRIAGGADADYQVRLRGNGYTGPNGYDLVDCATAVQPPCETSPILVLCEGALLGSSGDFTNEAGIGVAKIADFLESEASIDRRYDIFHDFLGSSEWARIADNGFPYSSAMQGLVDDGRIMLINWKNPGGPGEWAAMARGSQDAIIDRTAAAFADFDQPVFLAFHHEPEDNIAALGDTDRQFELVADFASVYRRIHDRFEAAGADNVIFVWDIMGFSRWYPYYEGGLYPGDDVVDWVAFNQYNWYGCHDGGRWRAPAEVFGTFYDWLDAGGPTRPSVDKPIMVGEFSTEENRGAPNSDQTKAEWYREIGDVLPELPRIKAMVMFDTEGRRPDGSVQFCEWSIASTPAALDGWRDLASLPYFNQWHDQ